MIENNNCLPLEMPRNVAVDAVVLLSNLELPGGRILNDESRLIRIPPGDVAIVPGANALRLSSYGFTILIELGDDLERLEWVGEDILSSDATFAAEKGSRHTMRVVCKSSGS